MNFDNLKSMSREELVSLAIKQGLSPHHKAKPETIIKQIIDKVSTPQATPAEYVDPRLMQKKEPKFNTEEDVERAVADIKAKVRDFVTEYNHEERTVTFKCRGREECHNLSVPLHWLKKCASLASQGKISPMGRPEFDSMNASGKNAYTNAVLAG